MLAIFTFETAKSICVFLQPTESEMLIIPVSFITKISFSFILKQVPFVTVNFTLYKPGAA